MKFANTKNLFILTITVFCLLCGLLVIESGIFNIPCSIQKGCTLLQNTAEDESKEIIAPTEQGQINQAPANVSYGADNAPAENITLGSTDPESGYKFQLELTSKGAAINQATFSGFNDRDYKNPQPLVFLSPVADSIASMANGRFVFIEEKIQLPLDKLQWKIIDSDKDYDGSQSARFETTIKNQLSGQPVLKLTKTYKIYPNNFQMECSITMENLLPADQKVRFDLIGPVGPGREGFRSDMRKAVAGFKNAKGQITSKRLAAKKLLKADSIEKRRLEKNSDQFLWIASVNKYFAAIVVPQPDKDQEFCDWVIDKTAQHYNPDGDQKGDTGDETIGVKLNIAPHTLTAANQAGSTKEYKFLLYIGPKDKTLFDKNELYSSLGFVQTIDFMACCCPAAIINPLAFGIMASMKWLYGFIPNYGVVIIIFVFIVRLVLHPLTKKGQISMSKMGKLGPRTEEIKKKYANNKAEMNKQVMALYKEQGASPITGMLPMFIQMPIWISLWSAVYASIDLRGAAFLPFWITDLSMPDALIRFSTVTIPVLGWTIESLNLLPLLMGVAFYLQQKLMPAAATTSPQAAQQQKMMKVMMPLLFPLMLYKAPSGVSLYIMASTFAGVIEQYVIRKHLREQEEAEAQGLVAATKKTGGKTKKKKPKPFYKQF